MYDQRLGLEWFESWMPFARYMGSFWGRLTDGVEGYAAIFRICVTDRRLFIGYNQTLAEQKLT
jgi:hypothetical protein